MSASSALRYLLDRLECDIEYKNDADKKLESEIATLNAAIETSKAANRDIEIPAPEGLDYLPYQRAGIGYAIERFNVLIGDDMGLGKTIQGIGISNADDTIKTVLIICPASLRINWQREWQKWDVKNLSVSIANGSFLNTDVVIINYDILKKHKAAIQSKEWDLLICDEAHYLKNPKAQRTAMVIGKWHKDKNKIIPAIKSRRKVMLTGTPILNKPIEAHPILKYLAPDVFGNWQQFVTRYCNGHRDSYGWDVSGASNLGELQERLRATIMVRRLKQDVLTELPVKRRQVIELPHSSSTVKTEINAWNAYQEKMESLRIAVEMAKSGDEEEYQEAVNNLAEGASAAFSEMAKLRHSTAVAKVPMVIAHLNDALENGKVICFAHHKDVINKIMDEFPGAVKITGDTKMEDRQAAVDRFQNDPNCKLFVGNIQAAGVGLTLTESSHVVFAELDWVPGNVTQAEDRAHRIGQKNSVLVQHLVLEGSLDSVIAKRLVEKQNVIDKALDKEPEFNTEPLLPVEHKERAATESTTRKQIADQAETLNPEIIPTILSGLQQLSALCDGASSIDGMGFSKIDTRIGHSLASNSFLTPKQAVIGLKIVRKYRKQIPAIWELIDGNQKI